jgi:hypothetical protein
MEMSAEKAAHLQHASLLCVYISYLLSSRHLSPITPFRYLVVKIDHDPVDEAFFRKEGIEKIVIRSDSWVVETSDTG